MSTRWKETPLQSKLATICTIGVAIAIIVLAILHIFDVWASAPYLYMPLMGINLLLQAYSQWKTNRGVALFSLCVAGFVFICTAVILILS